MQGIYINYSRPKSKKAIREAVAVDPDLVEIEATSWYGDEYGGSLAEAPDGKYAFVGPDPYSDRRFYGTITKKGNAIKVA